MYVGRAAGQYKISLITEQGDILNFNLARRPAYVLGDNLTWLTLIIHLNQFCYITLGAYNY